MLDRECLTDQLEKLEEQKIFAAKKMKDTFITSKYLSLSVPFTIRSQFSLQGDYCKILFSKAW